MTSDAPRGVGIDLGATHLRAALLQPAPASPVRLRELRVELLGGTRPDPVADRLAEAVAEVAGDAPEAPIGVGVAGMLRGHTGIVANAPNLGWRDVPFRALLKDRLPGRRIELVNDLNAIAYGEFLWGAGRGAADVLCVYLGSGMGGGIVAGGRLVEGAANAAGEIGHIKVVRGPSARACGCGGRGCVEAYVGGHRLTERARSELKAGARSGAVDLAGGDLNAVHPGHLDRAAAAGDPYACALWAEIAPHLGGVLASTVTLLNPGRLVMGGGVWTGAPELRRRVIDVYLEQVTAEAAASCEVVDAGLGDQAGILGAAALAMRIVEATCPAAPGA